MNLVNQQIYPAAEDHNMLHRTTQVKGTHFSPSFYSFKQLERKFPKFKKIFEKYTVSYLHEDRCQSYKHCCQKHKGKQNSLPLNDIDWTCFHIQTIFATYSDTQTIKLLGTGEAGGQI